MSGVFNCCIDSQQVRSIVRNITGIEEWIIEKAEHRQRDDAFIFPYNLGFWKNVKQVINFSGDPVGDGITWEVLDSCDQYTLTVGIVALDLQKL